MPDVAICAALYEAGRRFLGPFLAGVAAAARGNSAEVIFAIDDLAEPEKAVAPLMASASVSLEQAPDTASPAGVRATMLQSARQSSADVVVFADMDDWLLEDAVPLHRQALAQSDFSYGDQILVDAAGQSTGRLLYDSWSVPASVLGTDALCRGNFVGFGSSAVRRQVLSEEHCALPETVRAADWWFFSKLLEAGCRGSRTSGPVASYRQHDGSLLGAAPASDPEALLDRCDIVLRHYAALSPSPAVSRQAAAVERLAEVLRTQPETLANDIARFSGRTAMWHEDVARLADRFLSPSRAGEV
ncbi:MAG: hypothetical protein QNJ92_00500 [Alphaproteobacteria bacterium]|nr:hypothetical protein [Alphaproteobacteria bacterium]